MFAGLPSRLLFSMRPLSDGRGHASVCGREAGYFQRADKRTRTADLLITSLLAYVLARPTASGICAQLGGFGPSGAVVLSSVYQRVLARLQYGCSTAVNVASTFVYRTDCGAGIGDTMIFSLAKLILMRSFSLANRA
jgi:hypothetical protein